MHKKFLKRLLAGVMATALVAQVPAVNQFFATGALQAEAASSEVIYESNTSVDVTGIDFSDLTDENWDVKKTVTYAYTNDVDRKVTANFNVDAQVTINAEAYATLATDGNHIKFQGVTKLGDWVYTSGDSWPYLDKNSFTLGEDGNYTADMQVEFKDKNPSSLMEIDYEIVGVGFKGDLTIHDVKVTNYTVDAPEIEEKDPTVLSDLATESDFANWGTETGYQYFHGGSENAVPVLAYDAANQRLQVALDYTANAKTDWSEAKVTYTPEKPADVSNYNQISVDVIYPDELDGLKMKFFAQGVINKDMAVDESTAEDVDGMKKVTVTMGFTPTTTPLESLTIGIIGVSTSFKGNIYMDNLVLSQKNATEDFVKITSTPGAGTQANIAHSASSVRIADANADDSAKALFTYLSALSENNQVLFGHQNDVSRSVNPNAELGDVKDVTGSVSGIFGLDSLALTGSEAGGTDAASALANSIAYSKKAAENGALITLSTHMPNFTSDKIKKNADGSYDFYNCDFSEAKDLSNTCAEQILPGGAYNEVFNAYLDIVANYAKALQKDNIPVIFRPLHENTGSWFWWGSTNSVETYKSLYRYTRDYLESQGVHNMLYVYSPNGPLTSEEEFLTRYPGDEYVDILSFDYYDDYNTYPATSDGSFFDSLDKTCEVVSGLAAKKGKIASISECGVRVMKKDGSDNEGLLVKGNPVREEATGTNWYLKVNEIAKKNNMPYFLVWANFSDTNFYVPYKYNDTYGQEMINEFIDFYNDSSSIFGSGTNFYNNIANLANVTNEKYTNAHGYMIYPFEMATILEKAELKASVKNAKEVQFVVENTANAKKAVLKATPSAEDATIYTATLDQTTIQQVEATDVATITLVADGVQLAQLKNISLGKEKDKAPVNVIENFDFYSGSNGLLDASYTENSAGGCSAEFLLDTEHKNDGTYGGAFHYTLSTTGNEVWTGRIKSSLTSNDFSAYNALEMWVQPDGKGQKLVVQLTDGSGEEFEVYLTDFVKGTKAQYVTIPFSSFVGKKGGTLKTENITKFAVWCNSIVPEGHEGTWNVDSNIYFDGIKGVKITDADLAKVDENGLIITDASLVKEENTTPSEEPVNPPQNPVNPSQGTSKDVLQKIAEAKSGETIVIPVSNENTKVSKDVMEAAKGKDITLRFELENGVVWLINGKDIKEAKEIDLSIKLNTQNIPQSAINAVGDDKAKFQMQFSLGYEGEFGAEVSVIIPLGQAAVGYYANLYYYNPTTGKLEFVDSVKVGADGNATFKLSHASDYVIIVSENNGADLAKQSAQVKTGDTTNMAGYILLLGLATVVCVGTMRRKKHA